MRRWPDSPEQSCASSVGHASDDGDSVGDASATILLNGIQLVRCALPAPGSESVREVRAADVAVTGACGGLPLDVLFVVPRRAPAAGHEWRATLRADTPRGRIVLDLGAAAGPGGSTHTAHYLPAAPAAFSVTVAHTEMAPLPRAPPAEQQLAREVAAILANPRHNPEQGSLSSVFINNKAKESVLYDKVVGGLYDKSWSAFLKAHEAEFRLFYYMDYEIRDAGLAPHVKKSDARVAPACQPHDAVRAADGVRCEALRTGERDLKDFLAATLAEGEMSQRDLLAQLRECPGFTDTLFPTFSLLMRFLACHPDTFTWASDPDLPTRVGLRHRGRFPNHETPENFTKVASKVAQAAPLVGAASASHMAPLLLSSHSFYGAHAAAAPSVAPPAPAGARPASGCRLPLPPRETQPPAQYSWAPEDPVITYRHDPYSTEACVIPSC